MIKNFVMCGLLSILFYSISSYENLFGETNSTEYQFLNKFGGKGSENGQLVAPHSIDIDKDGNVYVTDTGNDRIQKYDSDGKFILKEEKKELKMENSINYMMYTSIHLVNMFIHWNLQIIEYRNLLLMVNLF
jgi:6-phosphogluconolactonase (cycloisomerase 2 family)